MHVAAWPGLGPAHLLGRRRQAAPFPLDAPHQAFFYVARNGIYHLFCELARHHDGPVLMPDYHSGNEVWAVRAAGAPVQFYRIDRNLQPDLEQIEQLAKRAQRTGRTPLAIYLIHFIGWPQPVGEIAELCRKRGILLIEDCALSLLSGSGGRPLGSLGDYSVYCLYKTLPVPNGGLLAGDETALGPVREIPLRQSSRLSVAGRLLELGLEWLRTRNEPVGGTLHRVKRSVGRALSRMSVDRTPVGDIGFDLANVDMGMSPMCHRLLERFDYDAIRRRRRANFFLMRELLADAATPLRPDLDEGVCPLFFPILVADKQRAAESLWAAGIDVVQFWNYGDQEAGRDRTSDACFLREHVLELPIHQDVSARHVEYIADRVRALGPRQTLGAARRGETAPAAELVSPPAADPLRGIAR